jgi:hypothetical protein
MVGLSICRMSTSQGQSHLTTRLPTGVRNQTNQRMPVSRTMVDCPRNTIPGLSEWPIRFDSENSDSNDSSGWFNVPYIWLLALRATYHYQGDFFFEELQLLDYRGLRAIAKEDPTLPGGFSWTKLWTMRPKVLVSSTIITALATAGLAIDAFIVQTMNQRQHLQINVDLKSLIPISTPSTAPDLKSSIPITTPVRCSGPLHNMRDDPNVSITSN